jgi:hypothetical protein
MKVLLVANVVDHGTRSITESYARELKPSHTIEIPLGVRQLGFRAWRDLGMSLRRSARDADVVVCLHHGALFLGALFLPRSRKLRRVAITDWTRAFPSRRRDLYIRCYNRFYALLVRAFDAIYSPAPGLRQCYESMINMRPTLYPLPYPEVTPDKWPAHRKDGVSILYIGATTPISPPSSLRQGYGRQAGPTQRLFHRPSPQKQIPSSEALVASSR